MYPAVCCPRHLLQALAMGWLFVVTPHLLAAAPAGQAAVREREASARALGETLTTVTTVAFANHGGLDVLSSADLRAVIALEAEKQMVGCDEADSACLAEIAGALGARFIVISQIGALERSLVLGLTLYDAQAGRAAGRELVRAASLEGLVEQVPPTVQRLVSRIPSSNNGAAAKVRVLVLDARVPEGFRLPSRTALETPGSATPTPIPISPTPSVPVLPVATPPAKREVLPLGGTGVAIACLQRAVPRALQSQDRYAAWVDMEAGPSCQERYVSYGLYAPYDDARESCAEAVAATREDTDVHGAVRALAQVVDDLWPVLKEASAYYSGEDYLDDGCARGKALHPRLVQGFVALHKATEGLISTLDAQALRALSAAPGDDSRHRRALIDLEAALLRFAQQAPLWRDPGWLPTPELQAAHEQVQLQWKAMQAVPAPSDPVQSSLWKAALAMSEARLDAFKRQMRGYRDLEAFKKQRTGKKQRSFDPEEIREGVYEHLLQVQDLSYLE
ncbi:MAG: DUF3829 domain-containing protein [Pseudomonadota bacterium]